MEKRSVVCRAAIHWSASNSVSILCSKVLTHLVNLQLGMLSSCGSAILIIVGHQAGFALAFELDHDGRDCFVGGNLENDSSADEVQVCEAGMGFVKEYGHRHDFKMARLANRRGA